MLIKTTNRLFHNKYKYKIVLTCGGASLLRNKKFDEILERLNDIKFDDAKISHYRGSVIKSKEELDWTFKLVNSLQLMNDIDLRVEQPWISIYTNTKGHIDKLSKLDSTKVKYISMPPSAGTLVENTIISSKINFEYRITLGKTTHEHSTFINWANNNKKLKLTKSCIKALNSPRSWGGTYFYITGDNNLLLAKMHLGEAINRVDRIVKA